MVVNSSQFNTVCSFQPLLNNDITVYDRTKTSPRFETENHEKCQFLIVVLRVLCSKLVSPHSCHGSKRSDD